MSLRSALDTEDGTTAPTARALSIAIGIYRLLPRGGLEDNCIRIAKALTERGHEVTIFVSADHPDLPIPTVSLAPASRPFSNHARVAEFARAFAAATKSGYERVVAFQPIPRADVLFSADWIRNRKETSLWRRLTPRFRTYADLEAGCFSAASKTRILGLSEPQMQAYVERYGTSSDRIAILPPTLPLAICQPERRTAKTRRRVRASLGIDERSTVWLWLGLQPAVKGLDRVLDALIDHQDTHLIVAGFPPSDRKAAQYKADALKKGVGNRVHWLGYIAGEELLDVIAAADALAHPARVDVTGGVILESIVNGLPVVASAVCGFADHVRKGDAGRIVPEPFSAEIFSQALGDVCGPANERYSANGIRYGRRPELYSGTSAACDLIEAETWPLAGRPAERTAS